MKNFIKLLGIIALVAVIGFGMTACDTGIGPGGEQSSESGDHANPGGNDPGGNNNGGNNNGSGGGTFTLNGIPSEYNGMYVVLNSSDSSSMMVGAESINWTAQTGTACPISNGKASLPLWVINANGSSSRYSGNDTCKIEVWIFNSISAAFSSGGDNPIAGWVIESVTFANGNATKSWSDGKLEDDDNGGGQSGEQSVDPMIVGTWYGTFTYGNNSSSFTFTFLPDGNCSIMVVAGSNTGESGNGSYSTADGVLTLVNLEAQEGDFDYEIINGGNTLIIHDFVKVGSGSSWAYYTVTFTKM